MRKRTLSNLILILIFIVIPVVITVLAILAKATYSMASGAMEIKQVETAIQIVLVVFFIAMPILGSIFVYRRYRKVWPKTKTTTDVAVERNLPDESWQEPVLRFIQHNAFQLLVIILILFTLPLFTGIPGEGGMRDNWYNAFANQTGALLLLSLVMLGSMTYHNPAKPFRWRLAKFGVILVLVFGFVQYAKTAGWWDKKGETNNTPTTAVNPGRVRSPYFRGQTHFQDEARLFWYGSIPPKEAWDMLDTIKLESRFQQYNSNGTVFVGVKNPRDTGMHMINLDESKDEIQEAGCDVEEIDCQFKVALLIYKKHGLSRWTAYNNVLPKIAVSTKKIKVPVVDWSESYEIQENSHCYWEVTQEVTARTERGDDYKLVPDRVPTFNAKRVVFQTTGEETEVVIFCRNF